MLDKPNGAAPGKLSEAPNQTQSRSGYPTIEDLAREARAHASELQDFRARTLIPARELRKIWNSRRRPFWRLNLVAYQALTRRLVELGENYLAIDAAAEGIQFFGNDPALILSKALASARCGSVDQAQRILAENEDALYGTHEYISLLGRTYKDLWKLSGDRRELEQSYQYYYQDYLLEKERAPALAPYPGANAATIALLLGKTDAAQKVAEQVIPLLDGQSSDYWQQVTRAECELVLGHIETSRERYRAAAASSPQPYANLMTTRAQARLVLRALRIQPNSFDTCFPVPRVACFSGHRIDETDARAQQFSAEAVEAIKARIHEAATRLRIGFGYSSASNSDDILFLEAMQESETEPGAQPRETYVNLPFEESQFLKTNVQYSSSGEWIERFRAVLNRATDVTRTSTGLISSGIMFEYANTLSFGAAVHKARELDTDLVVLAVGDGQQHNRSDTTSDILGMAAVAGIPVEFISASPGHAETLPSASLFSGSAPLNAADEAILHALAFSVTAVDEAAAADSIAAILGRHRPVTAEVHGRCYLLFFDNTASAADAAVAILSAIGPQLERSLGLHSLPVTKRLHPVTRSIALSAGLGEKAVQLAELDPPGQIYVTTGFSSFSERSGPSQFRFEFLGHRVLGSNSRADAIFRLVQSQHA